MLGRKNKKINIRFFSIVDSYRQCLLNTMGEISANRFLRKEQENENPIDANQDNNEEDILVKINKQIEFLKNKFEKYTCFPHDIQI